MPLTLPDQTVAPKTFDAPPATPDPRQEMYNSLAKKATDALASWDTSGQALEKKQTENVEARNTLLTPAIEKVKTAAAVARPELKKEDIKTNPPVPGEEVKPRAFLETHDLTGKKLISPEGSNALRTIVAGIGTIVTSLAGISAPVGALNALTGAMEGWAEGDAARVARGWQKFEAETAKVQRDNALAMKLYENSLVKWQGDVEAAQVNYQVALLEAGKPEYAMLVDKLKMDNAAQRFSMANEQLKVVNDQALKYLKHDMDMMKYWETLRHHDVVEHETERHHGKTEVNVQNRPSLATIIDPNDESKLIVVDAKTNKRIGESPKWSLYGAQFKTREKLASWFLSGQGGKALDANNTAINHLGLLKDYALALKNNDVQSINRLKQSVQTRFGLSSAPSTFEAVARVASGEVIKTIAATGGGVEERKAAQEDFDRAKSPDILLDVLTAQQGILKGKMDALEYKYDAMNMQEMLGKPFSSFLSPEARSVGKKENAPASLPSGVPQGSVYVGPGTQPDGTKVKVYRTPSGDEIAVD